MKCRADDSDIAEVDELLVLYILGDSLLLEKRCGGISGSYLQLKIRHQ